jgi:hypothetical protein
VGLQEVKLAFLRRSIKKPRFWMRANTGPIGWKTSSNSSSYYPDGMMAQAKNPRRSWRKETMIFEETDKRTRKKYTDDSKYWPDETRFRRRFTNKTLAKNVLTRIEGAIAMGTWQGLKKELTEPPPEPPQDFTVREFADIYLEEYCKVRNTRPDFKEETLKVIKNIVGDVKVTEFTPAHFFEKERKKEIGCRPNRQSRPGRSQPHVHVRSENERDYPDSPDGAIWSHSRR